jgi:hypothetical protein
MRLQSRVTVEVVSGKRIFVPQVVKFFDGLTNPNCLLVAVTKGSIQKERCFRAEGVANRGTCSNIERDSSDLLSKDPST